MNEEEDETTDLEYREAALRLAIESFKAVHEKPIPSQVIGRARFFEAYLREG